MFWAIFILLFTFPFPLTATPYNHIELLSDNHTPHSFHKAGYISYNRSHRPPLSPSPLVLSAFLRELRPPTMSLFEPVLKMLDYPQISHNSTLLTHITPTSSQPAWYFSTRPSVFSWCDDKILSLLSPIAVYWILSLVFYALDVLKLPYFEKRRIHESEEVMSRNKVTIVQVIKAVLWQQAVQTLLGLYWLENDGPGEGLDILDDMTRLAPKVATGVFVLLGPRTGETVLKNYGMDLVRWMYWWGIPFAQLWLSLWVVFLFTACLSMLMSASSLILGNTPCTDYVTQINSSIETSTLFTIVFTFHMLSERCTIIRSKD